MVGALHPATIASWWVVAQPGPISTTNMNCGVLVGGHAKRIETSISIKRPEKQALRPCSVSAALLPSRATQMDAALLFVVSTMILSLQLSNAYLKCPWQSYFLLLLFFCTSLGDICHMQGNHCNLDLVLLREGFPRPRVPRHLVWPLCCVRLFCRPRLW